MDAAREAILALRGTLDVRSGPGLGARYGCAIPLSLAMLDCLHVVVGTASFFIQLPSIEECPGNPPHGLGPAPRPGADRLAHRGFARCFVYEFPGGNCPGAGPRRTQWSWSGPVASVWV